MPATPLILPNTKTHYLAVVAQADNGYAKIIQIENKTLPVYAQASHVPYLNEGDEILYITTERGIYILARTMPKHCTLPKVTADETNYHFQFGNNTLSLNHSGELIFQTPHACVTLTANGDFIIAAKNIKQMAKENIYLNSNLKTQ